MADRVIRDEILHSDRWLGLARSSHRLAYIVLLLRCDPLGNLEASDGQLARMWRDTVGASSIPIALEILTALVEIDLVRVYEVAGKRYLHIPRTRFPLRYVRRICPPSPWTTDEQREVIEKRNQVLTKNSQGDNTVSTASAPGAHTDKDKDKDKDKEKNHSVGTVEGVTTVTPSAENGNTPPTLPQGLSARTWAAWKAHLAQKGKGFTGIAEPYALAQLAKHADPEQVVIAALAAGHVTLPPVGGWPSQQSRTKPSDGRLAVAQAIFGTSHDQRADDIDGTAERVA